MTWNSYSAVALLVVGLSISSISGFSAALAQTPSRPAPAQPASPTSASGGQTAATPPSIDEQLHRGLALQVALDRAGFSPGEIDGAPGANTERALAAFKAAHPATELGEAHASPLTTYTITDRDAAGPFSEDIPEDMVEKSKLPSLSYRSVLELLGERFHASPALLQRLNPAATFAAGEVIQVPNVEPFEVPAAKSPEMPAGKTETPPSSAANPVAAATPATRSAPGPAGASAGRAVTITVTDRTKTLQVKDENDKVLFHAPVTVGSENDPLPVGEWKINGIGKNPEFNYNPDLFWDAEPTHAKARIAPGPNNPVGVVWIDLSKEHYGIHGTPEPSKVGHTQSHGCIRLTNWDAMRVAALVTTATKVILQ